MPGRRSPHRTGQWQSKLPPQQRARPQPSLPDVLGVRTAQFISQHLNAVQRQLPSPLLASRRTRFPGCESRGRRGLTGVGPKLGPPEAKHAARTVAIPEGITLRLVGHLRGSPLLNTHFAPQWSDGPERMALPAYGWPAGVCGQPAPGQRLVHATPPTRSAAHWATAGADAGLRESRVGRRLPDSCRSSRTMRSLIIIEAVTQDHADGSTANSGSSDLCSWPRRRPS